MLHFFYPFRGIKHLSIQSKCFWSCLETELLVFCKVSGQTGDNWLIYLSSSHFCHLQAEYIHSRSWIQIVLKHIYKTDSPARSLMSLYSSVWVSCSKDRLAAFFFFFFFTWASLVWFFVHWFIFICIFYNCIVSISTPFLVSSEKKQQHCLKLLNLCLPLVFKVGGKFITALKIYLYKNVITRNVQMILINHCKINMKNVIEYV